MVSELFDWWWRQMADLLGGRLSRREAGGGDGLIVRVADLQAAPLAVSLGRRVRGVETPWGQFVLDDDGARALGAAAARRPAPVILDLPQGLMLEREIVLPVAAEADLEPVLGYEMDRVTPFSASELFWTWQLVRRDRAHGRLHVRLSLVHRPMLSPVLDGLRRAGLVAGMIQAPGADGRVRLVPIRRDADARRRYRGLERGLAVACLVLAVAVIAAPLVRNMRAIEAANARVEALRPRVAQVEVLRRRLADARSGTDVFAASAAKVGNPLQALAALTGILPDDTWLGMVSLRQRVLIFSGQSANAARLIQALSADPAWRNPTFATPVTRADAGGADQFSIRTEFGL